MFLRLISRTVAILKCRKERWTTTWRNLSEAVFVTFGIGENWLTRTLVVIKVQKTRLTSPILNRWNRPVNQFSNSIGFPWPTSPIVRPRGPVPRSGITDRFLRVIWTMLVIIYDLTNFLFWMNNDHIIGPFGFGTQKVRLGLTAMPRTTGSSPTPFACPIRRRRQFWLLQPSFSCWRATAKGDLTLLRLQITQSLVPALRQSPRKSSGCPLTHMRSYGWTITKI